VIRVADLFCGAGGASTGLLRAADARGVAVDLVAVNHWPIAVDTHTVNHPNARHFCQSIETLDPEVAVPSRKLDLLIAAPECVHFSTARGGRPMSDQSRASAWHLLRWLEVLRVKHVLIENVPEFQTWGPLGANGRPLKSRRGETFRAFITALESLNYRVEWKVLNAADYGAATTRRRLFLQARLGRQQIVWPKQTHSKTGGSDLFGDLQKWRPAREVIDWSLKGESIFARKRPLKPATIRRIIEGLRRFGGPQVQPFLVQLTHGGRLQSVDEPMRTVTTANRGEIGLAEPFMLGQQSNAQARPVGEPVPTVSTAGAISLIESFIVTPGGADLRGGRAVANPLPTVTGSERFALVDSFMTVLRNNQDAKSLDDPIPTLTAGGGHVALTEAFLTKYNRTATGGYSVDDPLDTVSTRDRFALVQPVVDGVALDIRFRMLQDHELAAAMSFPKGYRFTGNKGQRIKQIGNAWDVEMGHALSLAILEAHGHGRPARRRSAA
jgi:DNA (cytosine-5)-methyltransferase 1